MREPVGRRNILGGIALAGAALTLPGAGWAGKPSGLAGLSPLAGAPVPISKEEREARIEKARRLMRAQGISALLVEPGASLIYFTGIEWHRSERLTAAVIPVDGEVAIVTPFFEEPSVRQTLAVPAEVRVWEEDEDPLALVAAILTDRKLASGVIAIEETVRYFAVDGLMKALPHARIVSGAPVVRGCRMMKSPAEIALMQRATDVTIAAYRHVIPRVKPGMAPADVSRMMDEATVALGGSPEFSLVLMDAAAALPHGSHERQVAREGGIVLMDCGCTVQGYQSDVSRTFVLGQPSARQRQVWDQVHRGQQVAFEAARIGTPAGEVDDAVRRYYESLGYGPRYALPGLAHRTGHGIGLDGHEPVNLVHGEQTRLAAGMCFSDEPGLYIPGEFGIRLEDCFHMTEAGPRWFSTPPASIDRPV
ncbi:M24 family metallopeptidase [Sphingomonas oligoaromativorans]|uniref:M24 family metallopeptidase n=1 Tax=Sphingomonas oligoaromativorans TaxID=575322 RepID=UPI00142150FD|nr:Xaa-Pro peptidase family protein [Sphingomonas oligoaromativorans]